MKKSYEKLEELANGILDTYNELSKEINKICEEEGTSEDHHPLHQSAQNILRLERQFGEFIKAMVSDDCSNDAFKKDLKNIYLQRIITDGNFKFTGFARVLINAGLNK